MERSQVRTQIRNTAVLLAGLLLLGPGALSAAAADVSLTVPVLNRYVWRGLEANTQAVLQPSLTVSGSGLSFNLWGNLDLTGYGAEAGYGDRSGEFTELDLTGEYAYSFGPVALAAGVISYVFPGIARTTHELYGKVTALVPAGPYVAVFSDVDEIKGSYVQTGASYTLALEGAAPLSGVGLGATLGYGSGSYNRGYFGIEKAAPVDLTATLSVPLALPLNLTLTPAFTYISLLDQEISEARGVSSYTILSLGLSSAL